MTINAISEVCALSQEVASTFRKLIADDRAVVAVMSAFSLTVVIGLAALAVEYGHGLLQRSDNQRAADLAAYGGALVYNTVLSSSGSSAAAITSAESAALNIAALNAGVGVTVTPAIVASPRGDGNQAVQVTVTTDLPLYLARVLTGATTLPVTATASAEIIPAAPGSGTGKPTVALVE